jgi:hypothetical protein
MMPSGSLSRVGCFPMVAVLVISMSTAAALSREQLKVTTNESYLEEARERTVLTLSDPIAVFAFVLNSLPDRVRVYPTENYYYFRFTHNGTPYSGSIRFKPIERDQGKIQFGYYKELTDWKVEEVQGTFAVFDASHAVKVEKIQELVYRVSHGGKSVIFALYDASGNKPPPSIIGTHEQFLGPIFDESGIRFFLIYNWKLKIFHYLLDETEQVADELYIARRTERIVIGRRTGFAFYRDHRLDRKILIGAFETNSRVNNYFDGPFDQLPENFIEGEELRQAIVASDPRAEGQIDRFGNYAKEEGRYLIHPYMLYRKEGDLYRIHACAVARAKRSATYYRCFVIDAEAWFGPSGRPKQFGSPPR